MALIDFTVVHKFDVSAAALWSEMLDWEAHESWIPATRVELDEGDPTALGATFTGYTGYGRLTLVDRMRITAVEWDEVASVGSCEVEKLGPVLKGAAGFTVRPSGTGSSIEWFERVAVPYVPSFLAPVASKLGAVGFSLAMRKLAKVLSNRHSS